MAPLALLLLLLVDSKLSAKKPPSIALPATPRLENLELLPDYAVMHRIELSYKHQIEPIFKKWCYSCHHGGQISQVISDPLRKQILSTYLRKSYFALDLSPGFPFVGKATAIENLKTIERSLLSKHMPPFWWPYLKLSRPMQPAEIARVLNWTRATIKALH